MLYHLFIFFCFITSIYGTTVQLWTSDNKLLADVSSCDLCYNLSPEVAENLHRYYAEVNNGYWIWWANDNYCDDTTFYSTTSGYINYWNQGDVPKSFYIECCICTACDYCNGYYTIGWNGVTKRTNHTIISSNSLKEKV
jgi:hypothetical protein